MTVRDEVWDEVLQTIATEGRFKISDLSFDESQRHTVRRVLRDMEEKDWLLRESERGKIWYAGPRAKTLLNMEGRAELLSDPDLEL